jgi:hypothetical protein
MSKKRQNLNVLRRAFVKKLLEERMVCEARILGCSFTPTDVHEIMTRARGGSIIDEGNCLALCRSCHTFITNEPQWATEHGFIVHNWATPADLLAAERARSVFVFGGDGVEDEQW